MPSREPRLDNAVIAQSSQIAGGGHHQQGGPQPGAQQHEHDEADQQRLHQHCAESGIGQLRQRAAERGRDHAVPSMGFTGTRSLRPKSASSNAENASSSASPRGRATICSPTGRPLLVKPQESKSPACR